MKVLACVLAIASFSVYAQGPPITRKGKNYAVLVAGSNGWSNYRHQADICHAFQILTKIGGIPRDQITVMMADDIANNPSNPVPGNIINYPDGPNVYPGVNKDYTGQTVTAKNFVKVLETLPSTEDDNVFVYFSDHGAKGLVAMPFGDPLTADQLMEAFQNMKKDRRYKELVVYIEACESGSMFDGLLKDDMKIYATTASDDEHSSFAWFFDPKRQVYIADQYSIMWMQDSQYNMTAGETLESQYETTKAETNESSVMQFGDLGIAQEKVENFQASGFFAPERQRGQFMRYVRKMTGDVNQRPSTLQQNQVELGGNEAAFVHPVDSRDIVLETLKMRLSMAQDEAIISSLTKAIESENAFRAKIDGRFVDIAKMISQVSNQYPPLNEDVKFWMNIDTTISLKTEWQCLRDSYKAYEQYCEKFEDYSFKYVRVLYAFCSEVEGPFSIVSGIKSVCFANQSAISETGIHND